MFTTTFLLTLIIGLLGVVIVGLLLIFSVFGERGCPAASQAKINSTDTAENIVLTGLYSK